eukprot:gene1363-2635_t
MKTKQVIQTGLATPEKFHGPEDITGESVKEHDDSSLSQDNVVNDNISESMYHLLYNGSYIDEMDISQLRASLKELGSSTRGKREHLLEKFKEIITSGEANHLQALSRLRSTPARKKVVEVVQAKTSVKSSPQVQTRSSRNLNRSRGNQSAMDEAQDDKIDNEIPEKKSKKSKSTSTKSTASSTPKIKNSITQYKKYIENENIQEEDIFNENSKLKYIQNILNKSHEKIQNNEQNKHNSNQVNGIANDTNTEMSINNEDNYSDMADYQDSSIRDSEVFDDGLYDEIENSEHGHDVEDQVEDEVTSSAMNKQNLNENISQNHESNNVLNVAVQDEVEEDGDDDEDDFEDAIEIVPESLPQHTNISDNNIIPISTSNEELQVDVDVHVAPTRLQSLPIEDEVHDPVLSNLLRSLSKAMTGRGKLTHEESELLKRTLEGNGNGNGHCKNSLSNNDHDDDNDHDDGSGESQSRHTYQMHQDGTSALSSSSIVVAVQENDLHSNSVSTLLQQSQSSSMDSNIPMNIDTNQSSITSASTTDENRLEVVTTQEEVEIVIVHDDNNDDNNTDSNVVTLGSGSGSGRTSKATTSASLFGSPVPLLVSAWNVFTAPFKAVTSPPVLPLSPPLPLPSSLTEEVTMTNDDDNVVLPSTRKTTMTIAMSEKSEGITSTTTQIKTDTVTTQSKLNPIVDEIIPKQQSSSSSISIMNSIGVTTAASQTITTSTVDENEDNNNTVGYKPLQLRPRRIGAFGSLSGLERQPLDVMKEQEQNQDHRRQQFETTIAATATSATTTTSTTQTPVDVDVDASSSSLRYNSNIDADRWRSNIPVPTSYIASSAASSFLPTPSTNEDQQTLRRYSTGPSSSGGAFGRPPHIEYRHTPSGTDGRDMSQFQSTSSTSYTQHVPTPSQAAALSAPSPVIVDASMRLKRSFQSMGWEREDDSDNTMAKRRMSDMGRLQPGHGHGHGQYAMAPGTTTSFPSSSSSLPLSSSSPLSFALPQYSTRKSISSISEYQMTDRHNNMFSSLLPHQQQQQQQYETSFMGRPQNKRVLLGLSGVAAQRRMRRRADGTTSISTATSPSSVANGMVAKKILDSLCDITTPLEEERQRPTSVRWADNVRTTAKTTSLTTTTPSTSTSTRAITASTSTPTPSHLQSSMKRDRISDPRNEDSSVSRKDSVSTSPEYESFTSKRSRADTTTTSRTPQNGFQARFTAVASVTTPVQSSSSTSTTERIISKVTSSERDNEFSFESPTQVNGLGDMDVDDENVEGRINGADSTIRFVFSPPRSARSASKSTPNKTSGTTRESSQISSTNENTSSASKMDAAAFTTTSAGGSIWDMKVDKVKCNVCLVQNEKSAAKCVACESVMGTPATMGGVPVSTGAFAPSLPSTSGTSSSSSGTSFTFGAPTTAAPVSSTSTSATSVGFSFGSTATTTSAAAATSIAPSFGFQTAKSTAPSSSSSSFPSATTSTFLPSGFVFGESKGMSSSSSSTAAAVPTEKKDVPPSVSGFRFGAIPSSSTSSSESNKPSESTDTGFSFSGLSKPSVTEPSTSSVIAPPVSGFSFSGSFGAATSSSTSTNEDQPPSKKATVSQDIPKASFGFSNTATAASPSFSSSNSTSTGFSFGASNNSSNSSTNTTSSTSFGFDTSTSSLKRSADGVAPVSAVSGSDVVSKDSGLASFTGSAPLQFAGFGAKPSTDSEKKSVSDNITAGNIFGSSGSGSGIALQSSGAVSSLPPLGPSFGTQSLPKGPGTVSESKPFAFGAAPSSTAGTTTIPGPFGSIGSSSSTFLSGAPSGLGLGSAITTPSPAFSFGATKPDAAVASTTSAPFAFGSIPAAPKTADVPSFSFGSVSKGSTQTPAFGSSMTTTKGNLPPTNTIQSSSSSFSQPSAFGAVSGPFGSITPLRVPEQTTVQTMAFPHSTDSPGSTMDTGYASGDASNNGHFSSAVAAPSIATGGALSFGATPLSTGSSGFSFGASSSSMTPGPTFGSAAPAAATFGSSGFSFGSQSAAAPAPSTSFDFGRVSGGMSSTTAMFGGSAASSNPPFGSVGTASFGANTQTLGVSQSQQLQLQSPAPSAGASAFNIGSASKSTDGRRKVKAKRP